MDTDKEIKEFKSFVAIRVDGTSSLIANDQVDSYEYVYYYEKGKKRFSEKTLISSTKKEVVFPLTEITATELKKIRRTKKLGFVLKCADKYYYTLIPDRLHFPEDFFVKEHKCGNCNRMSALPDSKGGCQKVRDKLIFIENYSFITDGFEVFNTSRKVFPVFECKNFVEEPPRKKTNINASKEMQELFKYVRFDRSNEDDDDDDDDIRKMFFR